MSEHIIGRGEEFETRLFPPIDRRLYTRSQPVQLSPTADQLVAHKLLALAHQPLSAVQYYTGIGLSASGQTGRLLRLHKEAITAELAGQWQRADIIWRQVINQLRWLCRPQSNVWRRAAASFAQQPGVIILNDEARLRQRIVQELFLDTHVGFYNGYLKQANPVTSKNRGFVHLTYIKQMSHFAVLSQNDMETLVGAGSSHLINVYVKDDQWAQAVQVAEDLLRFLPDKVAYQTQLAKLIFEKTKAALQSVNNQKELRANARTLQRGAQRLEKIRRDYPHNLNIYQLAHALCLFHAAALTNAGELSAALLAVQKAVTYDPTSLQARQMQTHLVNQMNQLKRRVALTLSHLPRNVYLTPEGERLRRQAKQGTKAANKFAASHLAQKIARGFQLARSQPAPTSLSPTPSSPAPCLFNLPKRLYRGQEPVTLWLLGGQDLHLKGQFLLAAILLIVVGVLTFSQRQAQDAHNRIFTDIAVLMTQDNYPALIEQAEAYLTLDDPVLPLGAWKRQLTQVEQISLEAQISEAYEQVVEAAQQKEMTLLDENVEVFLHILDSSGLSEAEWNKMREQVITINEAARYNEAYEQVATAVTADDPEAVMAAAAVYLSLPPPSHAFAELDQQEEQVRAIYQETFLTWFMDLVTIDDTAQRYIKTYQELNNDGS